MRILLDTNLPPRWVEFLQQEGFEAVHWSMVGDARAVDAVIMTWARKNGFVVFSHDLDFSALLAATEAKGPSVVQVRTQDVMPEAIGRDVVRVLRLREAEIEQGAVVSIDKVTSRVRVLPIRRNPSGSGETG
jgi:predicted nuclease of predicted toxin-antitoxin system